MIRRLISLFDYDEPTAEAAIPVSNDDLRSIVTEIHTQVGRNLLMRSWTVMRGVFSSQEIATMREAERLGYITISTHYDTTEYYELRVTDKGRGAYLLTSVQKRPARAIDGLRWLLSKAFG